MAVEDDDRVLSGLGIKVDAMQGNGRITLSGLEYYQLKCAVSNAEYNKLETGGVTTNMLYVLPGEFCDRYGQWTRGG